MVLLPGSGIHRNTGLLNPYGRNPWCGTPLILVNFLMAFYAFIFQSGQEEGSGMQKGGETEVFMIPRNFVYLVKMSPYSR